MSLLGDFFNDWGKPLATAALIGTSIYQTNRAQKAREQQAKAYQKAQEDRYASEKAAFEAPAAGPMVIPALSGKAAAKASKLYKEYYGKSLDLFKPYVDSANRVFPQQEALYTQKGLPTLSALAQSMFSPESMAKLNQSRSAFDVPMKLPEYLKGGR